MAKKRVRRQPREKRRSRPRRLAANAAPAPPEDSATSSAAPTDDLDDGVVEGASFDREPDASVPTVVGVGASAGGLDAFSQLLEALPPGSPLAFVFVQHLSPQHESALPALLALRTDLTVVQVTEEMPIRPGLVYVIPPNAHMGIEHGTFHLSARGVERGLFTPVDYFLQSLAQWAKNRAVAVILSGTASDGAAGIREIKAAGGIAIAQTPATAKYDGMPRAAIATGLVDLILSPSEIAEHLAHIQRHPYVAVPLDGTPAETRLQPSPGQMEEIFSLLRRVSGIDFRHYKMPTVRRRLFRRMALRRITSVDDYVRDLKDAPQEVQALYQDLLIHVTRFFRDPEAYLALSTDVLPDLGGEHAGDEPVRIWVPGCATGEEAYSLAITFMEYGERRGASHSIQIFATDVSELAIEHARAAVYPASIASDVSPERLVRFFTPSDGGFRVNKTIRDMCTFARHDLTRDPPFSRLDLIMCRNVLIYLEASQQRRVMNVFHYGLKPRGFLMLGPAETSGDPLLFATVDKKWRLYRKVPVETTIPAEFSKDRFTTLPAVTLRPLHTIRGDSRSVQEEASRLLLNRYGPAGVVVDESLQVIQFRGSTGPFLEPAAGEPNLGLLKLVREGLLFPLRSAIQTARRTKRTVRKDGLSVRRDGKWHGVRLEVIPLGAGHLLVIFENDTPAARLERAQRAKRSTRSKPAAGRESNQKIATMARELEASREYLQSVIQELESANEELQSANEEILSSNEELQSTNEELDTAKEELQSTNEELNTLNEELHSRNEELSRVNADLVNLLGTSDLTILIVGNDMRIRRFTPLAERLLNLIPGDVGRPLGQINTNLVLDSLEAVTKRTIDTMTPAELDVADLTGRWFSLRIRPYKTLDNRLDGAVLTFVDIGPMKQGKQQLERVREDARLLVEVSSDPIVIVDEHALVRTANPAFAALIGLPVESMRGRPVTQLSGASWDAADLRAAIESAQQTGDPVRERAIRPAAGGSGPGFDVTVCPASFEHNGALVIVRQARHALA